MVSSFNSGASLSLFYIYIVYLITDAVFAEKSENSSSGNDIGRLADGGAVVCAVVIKASAY